jgi:hypothetical protein
MLSWSQLRAERCVIWFTEADAFLRSSAALSASSMNFPRFRVSAREQSSPETVCARQQRPHNFETAPSVAVLVSFLVSQYLSRV